MISKREVEEERMMERKVEFDVVAEINLIVSKLPKSMFIKSTHVRQ